MSRIPCQLCGDEALPATIERTGGYCMPCFKNPEGRRAWIEESRRPKSGVEDGLALLRAQLGSSIIAVASRAVEELGGETIYGFIIYFGQFGVGESCSVLTEDGLRQAWSEYYEARDGPFEDNAAAVASMRWNLADAPHLEYSDTTGLMSGVVQVYRDLEAFRDQEGVSDRIIRRALWAGIELRQSGVLPETVVITLMCDDMALEEKMAMAEYLNGSAALERFAEELGPLREDVLGPHREHYRQLMAISH